MKLTQAAIAAFALMFMAFSAHAVPLTRSVEGAGIVSTIQAKPAAKTTTKKKATKKKVAKKKSVKKAAKKKTAKKAKAKPAKKP